MKNINSAQFDKVIEPATLVVTLSSGEIINLFGLKGWSGLLENGIYLIVPDKEKENSMSIWGVESPLTEDTWKEVAAIVVDHFECQQLGIIRVLFNTGTEFKFTPLFNPEKESLFQYNGIDSEFINTLQ